MIVGSDTMCVEQGPSTDQDNYTPVHTYLLAEAGAPLIEVLQLEELAAAKVYEFGFFAGVSAHRVELLGRRCAHGHFRTGKCEPNRTGRGDANQEQTESNVRVKKPSTVKEMSCEML